ncbi:hypothetical protein MELA_01708 [Candidatus Methylomirabilis lanthanidiphila]|uniref:CDP-Glycerol:Poly(Glycerophosphate) glycerophosphotransferase n=1 Tax=Candidatus Methylomirabilis lanthanidiphila TaxID=2211376 RepID=A0A564ZJ27_9BACT|nr:hypothetical protein [Candidatus Methylomirabilis lanthanidiphila]VUZ85325.1 hypothetical protein MELA_01708 [Candidatus Methylomirabilis lanthanidiphila]
MRIGFLFNHYSPHQMPHAAPYAYELSRRYPEFEVVIVTSSEAEVAMARSIGALYPGHRCRLARLYSAWWYRLIDPLVSLLVFGRKNRILKDNLDFFRGLDALVSPERHCRRLHTQYGLQQLKLIHTRHGAGDREGTREEEVALFDFVLLPGQKNVDRLAAAGYLKPGRYVVTGYPKFEVIRGWDRGRRRLFDNPNPVVVYNPHFYQPLSSWSSMGHAVLDFFVAHPQYNLIFAPHAVLFERRWRHHASLPARYKKASNILIDTDSPALSDMTYTLAADIYLGDVSSQIYEFLLEPRPCIFLNGHKVAWENNPHYAHWRFGQVIDDVARELGPALAAASDTHPRFLPEQLAGFAYTFYEESGSTAAQRGADAIATFVVGDSQAAVSLSAA